MRGRRKAGERGVQEPAARRWLDPATAAALLACVRAARMPAESQTTKLPSHKMAAAVALESVPAAACASSYTRADVAELVLGDRRDGSGQMGKYMRHTLRTLDWLQDAVAAALLKRKRDGE